MRVGGEEDSSPELKNHLHSRQLLSKKGDPKQMPSRSTGWSMDRGGSEQVPFLQILAPCIQQKAGGEAVPSEFCILM